MSELKKIQNILDFDICHDQWTEKSIPRKNPKILAFDEDVNIVRILESPKFLDHGMIYLCRSKNI